MRGVGEHRVKPRLLFLGEEHFAGAEYPTCLVERIFLPTPMLEGFLLHTLPGAVRRVAGELDDVEGIHHLDRVGQRLGGRGFEACEPVHRNDLDTGPEQWSARSATPYMAFDRPSTMSSSLAGPVLFRTGDRTGFRAFENVAFTWYPEARFAGWFQADAVGTVTATLAIPPAFASGEHVLQATGETSGFVAAGTITVAEAAVVPTDPPAEEPVEPPAVPADPPGDPGRVADAVDLPGRHPARDGNAAHADARRRTRSPGRGSRCPLRRSPPDAVADELTARRKPTHLAATMSLPLLLTVPVQECAAFPAPCIAVLK